MYQAIISRIKTAPHTNADRLQKGFCHGFTVVIGLDIEDEQLGVFFPQDGVLDDEFCKANNLYPVFDSEGKRIGGGFIDPKNRRVRGQNFRGVRSEGFWVPISYFSYLGMTESEFKEGEVFTSLKGKEICAKYINEATQRAISKQKGTKKKATLREIPMLPMVEDTKQFRYYNKSIPLGARVWVTSKCHGTSGRTSYAILPYTETRLSRFFRILRGK